MPTSLKKLYYTTLGGVRKQSKLSYYLHGAAMMAWPRSLCRARLDHLLQEAGRLPAAEQDYVLDRVAYYCRLLQPVPLPATAPTLASQHYRHRGYPSAYFFDSYEQNRYFPLHWQWAFAPGDVTQTFSVPTICKSRPIGPPQLNQHSVLMKLNKVRHFIFFDDPFSFEQKQGRAIFRGATHGKPLRKLFFEQYFGHPMFDLRCTSTNSIYPEHMRQRQETSIYDHLGFKYIMCIEGNEVASNLKWVMNSNSLAVSPALHYETWFMEGRLVPGQHFIEVKPDFSDAAERLDYYNSHTAEARDLLAAAHEYCRQFQNPRRERLIALLTMHRYFQMTGQAEPLFHAL